jgi:hypothetical protein
MTSETVRNRVVRGWGAKYWFGEGFGVDGRFRWVVDRDERGFESSRTQIGERVY